MMKVVTITTFVEPMISLRLDQETFFISPSVAIRKSAVFGRLTNHNTSTASPAKAAAGTPYRTYVFAMLSCPLSL